MYKEFMFTGEVDIGLISATLYPITQVDVVDCWVYHFLLVMSKKRFMVMREVDICIIPDTIPPITQVGVVCCRVDLLLHFL